MSLHELVNLIPTEVNELAYKCEACKDESMILATEEDIKNGVMIIPVWDWEIKGDVMKKFCKCELARRFEFKMNKAGLSHLIDLKIDDYKTKYDWQQDIKTKLVSFVKSPTESFLISGQSGSGKTMAMSILFKNLVGKYGLDGKYLEWETFMTETNNNFREIDPHEYKQLQTIPILYIDDFLKCPGNDISNIGYNELRYARNIINQRDNKKLITMISTELTDNDLQELDESLHGRLIKMATQDYFIVINNSKEKNIRVEKAKGRF